MKLFRKMIWSLPRMTTVLHGKSALFSTRDILVPTLYVVKISIQIHLLSSYFH